MTGSTTALLSLGQPADQAADGPRGLFQLFGGSVLAHQARQLQELGVRRFIIAAGEAPGALSQLLDDLRRRGNEAIVVRSPAELATRVAGDDRLLVMADGLWCDTQLLADFFRLPAPQVAVVDDGANSGAFERIDLNHRWAGLALVTGRSAAALGALPPDWSTESALMRQALRDGAPRVVIPGRQVSDGQVRIVGTAGGAALIEGEALDRSSGEAGPVERWLFAPLGSRLLRGSWHQPQARTAFMLAPPALAALALVVAVLGSAVAASLIAVLALGARSLWAMWARLPTAEVSRLPVEEVTWILLMLALIPFFGAPPGEAIARTLMLGGLAALARAAPQRQQIDWWPGLPEVAVALLVGTLLGGPVFGWWLACFLCLGALLWAGFRRSERLSPP